jgi:hypothetical protein
MKNIKYFLLSFLVIVLFSKYSFAQMILSNVSAEREIATNTINGVMPIKTANWDDNHIISLVHYGSNKYTTGEFFTQGDILYYNDACGASVFYLTTVGTNATKRVMISNHTITDFCIVDDTIYMCGQNSAGNNFVAYENINIFFNVANNSPLFIYPISLSNPGFTLTNIDFCISQGQPRLFLLANDNQMNGAFICYDILQNSSGFNPYRIYYTIGCRLLDVVHTNNYIAVLGMKEDSIFTLTRHPLNNISAYTGKEFITGQLYTHFSDPKYHLATLRKDLNHVVVAESTSSVEGFEFNIINLGNLSILHTQAISNARGGRSKIIDLEFDEQRGLLYCLFCSGFYIRDMIVQIRPYRTQSYTALISKPRTYSTGYDLLKDLTLYGNNSQILTLGRAPGLNIYFFDRTYNFNLTSSCAQIDSLYCDIVTSPTMGDSFNYTNISSQGVQQSQQIQLNKSTINYNVICQ